MANIHYSLMFEDDLSSALRAQPKGSPNFLIRSAESSFTNDFPIPIGEIGQVLLELLASKFDRHVFRSHAASGPFASSTYFPTARR